MLVQSLSLTLLQAMKVIESMKERSLKEDKQANDDTLEADNVETTAADKDREWLSALVEERAFHDRVSTNADPVLFTLQHVLGMSQEEKGQVPDSTSFEHDYLRRYLLPDFWDDDGNDESSKGALTNLQTSSPLTPASLPLSERAMKLLQYADTISPAEARELAEAFWKLADLMTGKKSQNSDEPDAEKRTTTKIVHRRVSRSWTAANPSLLSTLEEFEHDMNDSELFDTILSKIQDPAFSLFEHEEYSDQCEEELEGEVGTFDESDASNTDSSIVTKLKPAQGERMEMLDLGLVKTYSFPPSKDLRPFSPLAFNAPRKQPKKLNWALIEKEIPRSAEYQRDISRNIGGLVLEDGEEEELDDFDQRLLMEADISDSEVDDEQMYCDHDIARIDLDETDYSDSLDEDELSLLVDSSSFDLGDVSEFEESFVRDGATSTDEGNLFPTDIDYDWKLKASKDTAESTELGGGIVKAIRSEKEEPDWNILRQRPRFLRWETAWDWSPFRSSQSGSVPEAPETGVENDAEPTTTVEAISLPDRSREDVHPEQTLYPTDVNYDWKLRRTEEREERGFGPNDEKTSRGQRRTPFRRRLAGLFGRITSVAASSAGTDREDDSLSQKDPSSSRTDNAVDEGISMADDIDEIEDDFDDMFLGESAVSTRPISKQVTPPPPPPPPPMQRFYYQTT